MFMLLTASLAGAQDIPEARVVIPWRDFQTLYERGQAPQDKPPTAPRDYAISRVTYTGEVIGEAAVLKATFQIDVLKSEGWTTVPLLPTNVALREAKLGRTDAPIYLDDGFYRLITDKRGPLTVEVEFAVATFSSSGQQGFSFQMARSGATEVALSVPSEDLLDFEVAGAQRVTTTDRAGSRTMRALLPSTGNLSVSWQRSAADDAVTPSAVSEPRIYAEHQALVGVSEGLLQCNSTVYYSILQSGIEQLTVLLPSDVTVLEVEGQGIRDWSMVDQGNRARLTVDLNFEAKGAYTLSLDYERPLAEAASTVEVPIVQLLGVERVKGWVGIDARSNLEIDSGDVADARVVDVRELPAGILGQTDWPVLLGFKYRKASYNIPLSIRQHEEVDMLVTIIDRAEATTVVTPDGRRMTQVTWSVRNNRAQFLRLDLPDGAIPWSTFVGGRAVKPARAEDGRVMVPLARSQSAGGELSRFAVEMVYIEDGEPSEGGRTTFDGELPIADVPTTAVAWTIYVPDSAKVKKRTIEGSLRQVDWFTPIEVPVAGSIQAIQEVQQAANQTFSTEAMAAGVQPVRVTLPVDGQAMYFEKLLVLDERLNIGFTYKE
ncbi:MAG: hypothetical protein P8R54_10010 [Myxococcota bacterium]|nr:hypothetical protein [Myxococcota bacterium]